MSSKSRQMPRGRFINVSQQIPHFGSSTGSSTRSCRMDLAIIPRSSPPSNWRPSPACLYIPARLTGHNAADSTTPRFFTVRTSASLRCNPKAVVIPGPVTTRPSPAPHCVRHLFDLVEAAVSDSWVHLLTHGSCRPKN